MAVCKSWGSLVQLLATAILVGIHFQRIGRFGQCRVQGPRRKKGVNTPTWLSWKSHAVPVLGWCGRLLGRPQGQESRALKGCLCCRLDGGTRRTLPTKARPHVDSQPTRAPLQLLQTCASRPSHLIGELRFLSKTLCNSNVSAVGRAWSSIQPFSFHPASSGTRIYQFEPAPAVERLLRSAVCTPTDAPGPQACRGLSFGWHCAS